MADTESVLPILPQATGYGVVIGIGAFFALFMLGVTYLQASWRHVTWRRPGLIFSESLHEIQLDDERRV